MNKKDEKITKELDKDRIISLKYEVAKLKEEYLELDKQCAVERETANGLDYTCENYEKQIIKLKEELECKTMSYDGFKNVALTQIKQLKSTLDEIKELISNYYFIHDKTNSIDFNQLEKELKSILAKHEGKQ